jgi:hypothetical protein
LIIESGGERRYGANKKGNSILPSQARKMTKLQ